MMADFCLQQNMSYIQTLEKSAVAGKPSEAEPHSSNEFLCVASR